MILNTNFLTEEEYYDKLRMEVLDEGFLGTILKGAASVLGYSGLTMLAGLGAVMIAKSTVSKEGKINKFFHRVFGKNNNLDFDAIKEKAVVRREINKAKDAEHKIPEVFEAIKHSDWDEAEMLFKKSGYTENTDVIKAIALAISDKLGEPPLYVYPSGNETYFKCKQILGIRYAKALTQSVMAALKQNKEYYKDVNI